MAFSVVADARKFVGASMSPIQAKAFEVAKRAVVRVGDGRGFVVSWSGVAFVACDKLLEQGRPVPYPATCDHVFAVIDTASKTGTEQMRRR